MLSALILPVLLAMVGMAIDLGGYADHRRTLQNAADSIALAAARDLPDSAAATASAHAWADKNGVPWSDVNVTITPAGAGSPNPKVSVDITRPHSFVFIRVLGVASRSVGAHAAAIKTSPGGAGDLMPWGVLQSVQQSAAFGDVITIKYDSNNVTTGNFGAIRLDGSGSSTYGDTINSGSTSIVCAQGIAGCTTVSSECTGSVCPTEPGNKVGDTRTGVQYRLDNTDAHCDTFAEAFSGPTNGKYTLNKECNPWLSGSYKSLRVVIVPTIASLCNGSCNVTITGFSLFWLEGFAGGGCKGNDCEVQGRFVNADMTIDALTGIYDANSSVHFTKLSE